MPKRLFLVKSAAVPVKLHCVGCGSTINVGGGYNEGSTTNDLAWSDADGTPFRSYYCYDCAVQIEPHLVKKDAEWSLSGNVRKK